MRQVAVFYDVEEAQIARGFLRSHGLGARLPDEQALSAMPEMRVGLGGYRLTVPEDEVAIAEKLLAPLRGKTGLPACERCGANAVRRMRHWWFPLLMTHLFGHVFPFAPARKMLICRRCGYKRLDPDEPMTQEPA